MEQRIEVCWQKTRFCPGEIENIFYLNFLQVFGGHISKYMIKFNLFCWLTPLLSPLTDYFLTEGVLLENG